MKKNVRRLLALCLTLGLMLSMAVVVSAASKTFTYEGTSYTAVLTKDPSVKTVTYTIAGSNRVEHISDGVDTPMYGPGTGFSFTLNARNVPTGSFYAPYISDLMSQVNLKKTFTATWNGYNGYHYVEPYKPSGTYQWAVKMYYYDANWEVRTGDRIPYGGRISMAPEGIWAYDSVRVG